MNQPFLQEAGPDLNHPAESLDSRISMKKEAWLTAVCKLVILVWIIQDKFVTDIAPYSPKILDII